ncbi:bifunctional glutamate N-acetyltransferase/amino-acid acetyltransferase ArgJ [Bifidobacterium magnum]|uniref:Arginine biosynthesis bifunctional protein ArgJ n=1 Tax=Bifidobacterium magnum TaxID=1692 RepID=A0A087B961_9BIFI|nr:bifunctional glutamate N-acetyltransferase/amino-acid acetyltransferase ArgJ [Bifidobacterium magnum]KFI67561.1 Glutamate N-acetyltransferase/amino-acid acetyltransferase ArgJ [Bifidobacterium magnum]
MTVTFPSGFSASGVCARISAVPGKKDLALVMNEGPYWNAAGVFTTNRFCAAPVRWTRAAVADGHLRAVVLNSGGANACTGAEGYEQSVKEAESLADMLGIDPADIGVCSTGIIGKLLPLERVCDGILAAYASLGDDENHGMDAAQAIMTTDTRSKTVAMEGSGYRMGGMVKGAGMIAPQLATMLCVITTDAVVSSGQMQAALNLAVDTTFNRIDVDGCMSTNDTVLLLSSGASDVVPDPDEFNALVKACCKELSQAIVNDGEGSSHTIRITVAGAQTQDAALACARAIAASNLLKCAISGNDPNWGRIVSSLGTVPVGVAAFDPDHVDVTVNDVCVCRGGTPATDPREVDMAPRLVRIDVDLHAGEESADVWTDDLTHEYVHINADYES